MKYKSVKELIGNTPIIEIPKEISGLKNVNLFVKCELFNPFGSLKDRAALYMYNGAKKELEEKGIKTLIEASSGNTAKALTVIAGMDGYGFETITNRIKLMDVKDILKVLGAEIEELPGLSECPDMSDPNDPINVIERKVATSKNTYYHTSQYTNLDNPKAHFETTGPEIQKDLGKVDYFFGTLGTTGSSRGIIEYLLTKNPDIQKIGVVGDKRAYLPGIRNMEEMLEVGIFEKELYNDIVEVSEEDALDYMFILNRKLRNIRRPYKWSKFCSNY